MSDDQIASQLKPVIDDLGTAFQAFKTHHNDRLDDIERKLNFARIQPGDKPSSAPTFGQFRDSKTHALVPVLSHEHKLAALPGGQKPNDVKSSVGRVLRGIVLGSRADDARELAEERKALEIGVDTAGGYTVTGALSAEWIDQLRSAMVLSRAGARTVPMDSNSLTLAKLTGDPVVAWHGENDAITESTATFGAVSLTSKTVVCLVKLSLELAQDSTNIETILQSTLTNSLALAIDKAGLVGVSTDAAAAPGGVTTLTGRNKVTSIGAPTSWDFLVDGMYSLMANNVPAENIGALVAHPALWKKMRKLKTGIASDNTPLQAPAEVAALPKLWTTSAPLSGGTTATGVIANWADLLFGVRKAIDVRVLREAFLGSNLQLAVLAYARCDFQATREQSFCTLEGITV